MFEGIIKIKLVLSLSSCQIIYYKYSKHLLNFQIVTNILIKKSLKSCDLCSKYDARLVLKYAI